VAARFFEFVRERWRRYWENYHDCFDCRFSGRIWCYSPTHTCRGYGFSGDQRPENSDWEKRGGGELSVVSGTETGGELSLMERTVDAIRYDTITGGPYGPTVREGEWVKK